MARKASRSKGPSTSHAERRADGVRIDRWVNEAGETTDELEVVVLVSQLGSKERGLVSLSITGAEKEHFDVYLATCKGAGGRFIQGSWRFPAETGLRVAEELRKDGFVVERQEQPAGDDLIYQVLGEKFSRDQMLDATINITSSGFVVAMPDGIECPCTLGEALLFDEMGANFTRDAHAKIRSIRCAAGFPNAGRGRGLDDDNPMIIKVEAKGSGPVRIEPIRAESTPSRNAPCPCGSSKKYKKCCGAIATV